LCMSARRASRLRACVKPASRPSRSSVMGHRGSKKATTRGSWAGRHERLDRRDADRRSS
jgi:hypothetical protein